MVRNGKEEIIGRDVTVEEVMEEVLKDMPHFRRSGGGLTLSGGESLLQPDFASALFQAAKAARDQHCAGVPPGFAGFEVIKERFCPGWICT